jgi:hypothetical protein
LTGSLVVAGLVGLVAQSGLVFVLAFGALLAIDVVAGNIRVRGRGR